MLHSNIFSHICLCFCLSRPGSSFFTIQLLGMLIKSQLPGPKNYPILGNSLPKVIPKPTGNRCLAVNQHKVTLPCRFILVTGPGVLTTEVNHHNACSELPK